jgi:hypothetical protein
MSQNSANSIPSIWLSFHIVESIYKKIFIHVDFLSNAIIFIHPYVKVSYDEPFFSHNINPCSMKFITIV